MKALREVVLDTETTGLDPADGHRIVEIGCVELANHLPTGRTFQTYLNPERDMPVEAFRVHGLSSEFLADKPRFADVAEALQRFIGADRLIIHNAGFDLRFLNAELRLIERAVILPDRVLDTLDLARRRYPGGSASLDALCRRFSIDLSGRSLHGALLDAQLLAAVYLELVGGREPGLALGQTARGARHTAEPGPALPPRPVPLEHWLTAEEEAAHERFLDALPTEALWRQLARTDR